MSNSPSAPILTLMAGLSDRCAFCGVDFPYGLSRCSLCRKSVCGSCMVRVGGSVFCSRQCGHAFFYGSEEDEIENMEKQGDPDGE